MIPFRYQGQYEDIETGLYYNRFRYYDAESGVYISQDPIGLEGGMPNFYSYVTDSSIWVDFFGLTGIIYLRTNPFTGEEYVGQTKNRLTYKLRQYKHNRKLRKQTGIKNAKYRFDILEEGITPGTKLDVAEEDWIRAGGGPDELGNARHQMNDTRYKNSGGNISCK